MAHQNLTAPQDLAGTRELALATARSVPGVADAAVILRRRLRQPGAALAPAGRPPAGRAPGGAPTAGRTAPDGRTEPSGATPPPAPTTPAVVYGAPLVVPPDYPATLVDALARAARTAPDRGTTYLLADGGTDRQTYADLLADAERVLGGLRAAGLRPGEAVLLQLADNRRFVTTFWACVLGGFLPTPVGMAPSYTRDNAVVRKLHAAWLLLDRPVVVTERAVADGVAGLGDIWRDTAPRAAVFEELRRAPRDQQWYRPRPDEPAVNLLTSGSTGVPKCVHHPHRTLVARTYATCLANGFTADEVSLNWMPLDHVGGIIMYNMRDVFLTCEHVNARTEVFVGRPLSWLDWIDRYRATNTWAPNFAFAMVNDCADEIEAGSWDLSTLGNICNAGEAVVARTAHRFLRLLARHGLPASAMRPCWGMSETSSGVTYSRMDRDDERVSTETVDKSSLGGPLRFTASRESDLVTLTNVGGPIPGVNLRVVDTDNAVLPECHVGRLQVSGATILDRYYNNPAANAEAFTSDGWFNTGDLAFLRDGRLTLTGREKDLIIVNGANYLTSELETVVEQVPGVEVTYVAACGVHDPDHGTDRVVIFFVPAPPHPDLADLGARITTALATDVGLRPDLLVPLSRAEFPKTASGKIQRSELVTALQAGRFAGRALTAGPAAAGEGADDGTGRLLTTVWCASGTDTAGPVPAGPWLVLVDDGPAGRDIGAELAQALPAGTPVRVVPAAAAAPDRLLAEVAGGGPVTVVHAVTYGRHAAPGPATWLENGVTDQAGSATRLENSVAAGPVCVLAWVRALAESGRTDGDLVVLTSDAVWVEPGDRVDPARAALTGLVRTAALEAVAGRVRLLDVADPPARAAEAVLGLLTRSAGDPAPEPVTAVRDGTHLVPRLRTVAESADRPHGLRPGGLYLLTGGLGGIGYELTQHLVAGYGASVLAIGRTAAGAGSGELAQRLGQLQELGEVRYAAADVTDPDALAAAVAAVEAETGKRLAGVLHLAGASVAGYWDDPVAHTLDRESPAELREMLRPKLAGCWAIGQLLADRPDALLVLFSSVSGFFGGRSFGAYAAANSALDGFAEHWGRVLGRPVRCLAWSIWNDVGMSRKAPQATVRMQGYRLLDVTEGLLSFVDAMARPERYLVIGVDPANPHVQRMMDDAEFGSAELVVAVSVDPAGVDHAGGGGAGLDAAVRDAVGAAGIPARVVVLPTIPRGPDGEPDEQWILDLIGSAGTPVGSGYVEPRTETERVIAEIFREVLDLPRVGRDDNFFTLGGNSVRVMRAMARMNEVLGGRHPARVLYDNPTPGELAGTVSAS